MRVVQTVLGTFHHFDLAHELERQGHLEAIYSTFPWRRLQREGLPQTRVKTFPWVHTTDFLIGRHLPPMPKLQQWLRRLNLRSFDHWTDRQITALERSGVHVDALIAISGTSLRSGAHVRRNGGIFVCDRGSTHQRYQYNVLTEEYRHWGLTPPEFDPSIITHEEACYAEADAITIPSTACVRSFEEMGVPSSKLHRIPYGVNLERFQPMGEPEADTFECLFAGQVSLRKGIPYLLEAFAAVQHPRKRLRVVGSMQADMASILSRFPTADVEFLGSVPQTKLMGLMSTSHLLVLPSIEEGLALVQAQAMACGCPVLCSRNSGGEDLFEDGTAGFIVPIRDAHALTDRMQQVADDPVLQATMRAAALERVRQIGGWKQYGEAWEKLLLNLTNAATQ